MTYIHTSYNNYNNNVNIRQYTIMHNNSWCQIVLDLLDLTFPELFYGLPHYLEHSN